jgi:RecA/RadA recombinase
MATPKNTSAKKAAKKAPAKKAAAKKTSRRKVVDLTAGAKGADDPVKPMVLSNSLDLFASPEAADPMILDMKTGLQSLVDTSRKKPVNFQSMEQMRKVIIPLDELQLQHALGSVGLRAGTVTEFIGAAGVGKTTVIIDWLSHFGLQGCLSLYIECENKQIDPNRIHRALHRDKRIAGILFSLITFSKARQLLEAEEIMNKWIPMTRAKADSNPHFAGRPLVVVMDPWGSLKSSGEAAGVSDWGEATGKGAKKKVAKDTGAASNLGHSKYAHAWKRRLAEQLEKYNVILILVNHQNQHIDMGGYSAGPGLSEKKNDTTIGGEAIAQIAAYRFTLTSMGSWDDTDRKPIGDRLRLFVLKNSFGPKFRECELRVRFDRKQDTQELYDEVVSYSYGCADWMVDNAILGTKVDAKRYTCETLSCTGVTAPELYRALKARTDVLSFVGRNMEIEGYLPLPTEVEEAAPPPPPTGTMKQAKGKVVSAEEEAPPPPPPLLENAAEEETDDAFKEAYETAFPEAPVTE